MIFCTLVPKPQLANALLLAESIREHHPGARLVACLAEHFANAPVMDVFDEITIVTNHTLPMEEANGCSAAKVYFLKHLLDCYPEDKIIYLDPEMRVYGDFNEVERLLDDHELIATPYHLEPCEEDDYRLEIERLRSGFLYGGFLALRGGEQSRRFLAWWSARIDTTFFGSTQDKLSDHRWLSLAMVPFRLHLLKDPTYVVSAWNLHAAGRKLSHSGNGGYLAGGRPLRSFLFANPGALLDERLNVCVPDESAPVRALVRSYREALERTNQYVADPARTSAPPLRVSRLEASPSAKPSGGSSSKVQLLRCPSGHGLLRRKRR